MNIVESLEKVLDHLTEPTVEILVHGGANRRETLRQLINEADSLFTIAIQANSIDNLQKTDKVLFMLTFLDCADSTNAGTFNLASQYISKFSQVGIKMIDYIEYDANYQAPELGMKFVFEIPQTIIQAILDEIMEEPSSAELVSRFKGHIFICPSCGYSSFSDRGYCPSCKHAYNLNAKIDEDNTTLRVLAKTLEDEQNTLKLEQERYAKYAAILKAEMFNIHQKKN